MSTLCSLGTSQMRLWSSKTILRSTNRFDAPGRSTRFSQPKSLAAEIETEQALVAANRELIARFAQKIQATLARVWGEAAPAAVHAAPPAVPSSQQDIYNETLIVNS